MVVNHLLSISIIIRTQSSALLHWKKSSSPYLISSITLLNLDQYFLPLFSLASESLNTHLHLIKTLAQILNTIKIWGVEHAFTVTIPITNLMTAKSGNNILKGTQISGVSSCLYGLLPKLNRTTCKAAVQILSQSSQTPLSPAIQGNTTDLLSRAIARDY